MRIFAGVLWTVNIKRQSVRLSTWQFSVLSLAISLAISSALLYIQHYYIAIRTYAVTRRLSTDPEMHDLE